MHFAGLKTGELTKAQFDGSWAQGLTQAGYALYAFDLQSHGRSQGVEEGKKCFVDKFQDFVDDIILYYSMVSLGSSRHPSLSPSLSSFPPLSLPTDLPPSFPPNSTSPRHSTPLC